MGTLTPEQLSIVGRIARSAQTNPDRVPLLQRELRISKLRSHIEQVLASAPPLTVEQREKLAALFGTRPIRRATDTVDGEDVS